MATTTVTAQFFPFTGEVRLANINATPFDFVYYSITSSTGGLNGNSAVWRSITNNYDASGNGFIDATHHWHILSSNSTELTEAQFAMNSDTWGTLPAGRSISLGNIWNPAVAINPNVTVLLPDDSFANVIVKYGLDGDYNGNNVVDGADHSTWKLFYGSTVVLIPDGNLNGVVDAADYTVWRDNLGKTLIGTIFASSEIGEGFAAATAVPEPSTALAWIGSLACLTWLAGRRR